jgi:hypothetical protein
MAYETTNAPQLVTQGIGNQGPAIWIYNDDDAAATVRASGYITNGGDLGMKVGDLVLHHDLSAVLLNAYRVVSVSSTAPGAVDLSDASVLGSATNSD